MLMTQAQKNNEIPDFFNITSETRKLGFVLPFFISHNLYSDIVNYAYTLPNLKTFTRSGHLSSLLECCCEQIPDLTKYGVGEFDLDCFDINGGIITRSFVLSIMFDENLLRFNLDYKNEINYLDKGEICDFN